MAHSCIDLAQRVFPEANNGCRQVIRRNKEHPMLDILMLALAAAWFALAIGYAYACERL